jgi:FkbM family methyltransferase
VAEDCQIEGLAFLLELFLGRRGDGVFVEVGAFDGVSFSNTSGLARAGWRGWYVEPVPESAALCRANYAGLDNVTVEELAIGASSGELTLTVGGPLSTADAGALAEFMEVDWSRRAFGDGRRVTVPMVTLDTFLDERGIDEIDVLVVDVEGAEDAVFSGFDVGRRRPKMLIVELVDTHPDLTANRRAHARIGRSVADRGYRIVYKDPTNTVFVRDDVHEAAFAD